MSITDTIKLALSLIGKRDELGSIVVDALALVKKIETVIPDLKTTLEAATATTQPAASTPLYSVKWLQESLNKLVNAGLTTDGNYGDATKEAVKQFQTAHGLEADGWAGALTTAAIIDALK